MAIRRWRDVPSLVRSSTSRDPALERTRDPVPTPYDAQAHTTVRQAGALGVQVLLEQEHQVTHLASRAAPIVRGKRVERKSGDPQLRGGFHRSPDRLGSGDMARRPGSTSFLSPAAVPIHDDRDMESVPASARPLGTPR